MKLHCWTMVRQLGKEQPAGSEWEWIGTSHWKPYV